jgi:wyosine [tRNA(Phe)-imidazoG37] synthetase (radical SAM superfamily)
LEFPEHVHVAVPVWKDGELRPVPVVMWPAVDQHMAHVDGWTAVVFRDASDNTWQAMAVHAIVHSIPEFREKNKDDSIETIMAINDYATRDDAFAGIKHAIKTGKPASTPTKAPVRKKNRRK